MEGLEQHGGAHDWEVGEGAARRRWEKAQHGGGAPSVEGRHAMSRRVRAHD
jgi:hypothetical protein